MIGSTKKDPSGLYDRERDGRPKKITDEANEETSVLVEDETILKRFPPLRRMWQPVGEQRGVWVPEENDDFTLHGSLDLTSGRAFTQAFEKGRSDYTLEYLKLLLEETVGKVLLILDQATWHTSGQVTEWLENTGRIETYLLPVRSPEATPMEDLWRELKEQVAAYLERSLDALLENCQEYFRGPLPGAAPPNSWTLSELTYFFCSTYLHERPRGLG